MSCPPVEATLSRVLSYLRLAGVQTDLTGSCAALRLVEQALTAAGPGADADQVFRQAFAALPDRFTLPEPAVPPRQPAICRGSIGYNRA